MMLRSKAAPWPLPRRHSPTPPKAQSPPSKKPKDEPQAKEELLEGREPGLSEQGGQPASSASGPAEPAGGGSWNTAHLRSRMRDWAEQQSDQPQRYDEHGHRVRRDISTLIPVPVTFYQDEKLLPTYLEVSTYIEVSNFLGLSKYYSWLCDHIFRVVQ